MNPSLLAALALAALPAVACCGTPDARSAAPEKSAAAAADRTKVEAPVEIAAELAERSARVTVRFGSPAAGVRIDVSGVDGLQVNGDSTLVDGASYDRGAEVSFDVAFTPGPGRSHLAVAVSGTFGGGHRAQVRSFSVGAPTAEQQKGRLTTEPQDGERVKVVVPGQ